MDHDSQQTNVRLLDVARQNLVDAIMQAPRGSKILLAIDEGDGAYFGWSSDTVVGPKDLLFYAEMIRARALELMFNPSADPSDPATFDTAVATSREAEPCKPHAYLLSPVQGRYFEGLAKSTGKSTDEVMLNVSIDVMSHGERIVKAIDAAIAAIDAPMVPLLLGVIEERVKALQVHTESELQRLELQPKTE